MEPFFALFFLTEDGDRLDSTVAQMDLMILIFFETLFSAIMSHHTNTRSLCSLIQSRKCCVCTHFSCVCENCAPCSYDERATFSVERAHAIRRNGKWSVCSYHMQRGSVVMENRIFSLRNPRGIPKRDHTRSPHYTIERRVG